MSTKINKNIDKTIVLKQNNTTWILDKEYNLYELYNDFLIDHDEEVNVLNDEDLELCENIREYYIIIFKNIPDGTYDLKEFEKMAKNIYKGE